MNEWQTDVQTTYIDMYCLNIHGKNFKQML